MKPRGLRYGFVVRAAPVRCPTGNSYICDDDKREGLDGAVGLGDLDHAKFWPYAEKEMAQRTAFWQLGNAVWAVQDGAGKIRVLG